MPGQVVLSSEHPATTGVTGHANQIQSAISSGGSARSALVASWQRSVRLHGLNPQDQGRPQTVTDYELREVQQYIEPLIHLAQPVLDRLFLNVGNIGCCVLLADRTGVPVARRGAVADDETFHRWGLWPGAVWSEASEGTNGIGTCIVEQRALTIHREQHFHTRNVGLSCSVAPIHDHLGQLIAVLDVSSCRSDLTEAYAALIFATVSEAARKIEADYFRYQFQHARIVLAPVADNTLTALLAIDKDDMIIGASRAARHALGIMDGMKDLMSTPFPAADLFTPSNGAESDMAEAERGVIIRALARTEGNISKAAQLLGISRATLHRKLNRLQVRADQALLRI